MLKRNLNGTGSIKFLRGQRSRPYLFVVTKDKKTVLREYFETKIAAEQYRLQYIADNMPHLIPRKIEKETTITFAKLFPQWLRWHVSKTNPAESTIVGYKASFNHCKSVHHLLMNDIDIDVLQDIIDTVLDSGLSYATAKKIRSLMSLMFDYAIRRKYTKSNNTRLLILGQNKLVRPHHAMTTYRINRLWDNVNIDGVDTVLMLIYTGCRVSELLNVKLSDVNRRQKYFVITHAKTKAGTGRIIPIHSRIWPLVEKHYQNANTYLLEDEDGKQYNYSRYTTVFNKVMKLVKGKHTTHDCRHTCATLLDNGGANPVAKRRILGHIDNDIDDRVYTHKNLRQLRRAIQCIK